MFSGSLHDELGDLAKAEADFTRAVDLNPNDDTYRYNRGIVRYKRGDDQGGIEDFGWCILLDENQTDAYFWRGLCYERMRAWTRAKKDFVRVVATEPTGEAYYHLGLVMTKMAEKTRDSLEREGAISNFTKALELLSPTRPNYVRSLVLRGREQDHLGRPEDAIADYTKALEIVGTNSVLTSTILVYRAIAHRHAGHKVEFNNDLQTAASISAADHST
jgi:tetratricopeptide (TPR) repeat protein